MGKILDALNRLDKDAADARFASLFDAPPADARPRRDSPRSDPPSPRPEAESPAEGSRAASRPRPTPPSAQPESEPKWNVRVCPLTRAFAPLMPFGEADWVAGEQYRLARTRIVQHPRRPRFIVVSSPASGDGKSITASNLAGALSLKSEGRVLLIDGDFRRSSICALLGIPETPGLADVLSGRCSLEAALIQIEQQPSLYVLPAGEAVVNPTELFDSTHWASAAATLRGHFRYVIVDSPSVGIVADYDLIQAQSDGVVIVLRPDHTHRKSAIKAVEAVPKDKLIGVMLNCVTDWVLQKRNSPQYVTYRSEKPASSQADTKAKARAL